MNSVKTMYVYCLTASVLMFSSLLHLSLHANTEARDYQCSFVISPGVSAVREFELGEEVFDCLQQSDYRDIIVTNSLNQRVPITFRHPKIEQQLDQVVLPFYPEPQQANFNDASQINQVLKATDIDITELEIDINKQAFYSSVIVDLSGIDTNLVNFQLIVDTDEALKAAVIIEVSDTLNAWRLVGNQQYLQLTNNKSTLHKSLFTLPMYRSEKYMRLSFISSQKEFYQKVETILANVNSGAPLAKYQWKKLESNELNINTKRWQYSWQGKYPIDQLRFSAKDSIRLYSGNIYVEGNHYTNTYSHDKSERIKDRLKSPFKNKGNTNEPLDDITTWQYKKSFKQQWLGASKADEKSKTAVDLSDVQKIELQFNNPLDIVESQLPDIEMGWQEVHLLFLAQGKGPYTLLAGKPYDKEAVYTSSRRETDLFNSPAEEVKLLEKEMTLAAPDEDSTDIQSKSKLATYLLWALLFCAFVVLIVMVIKLTKGMSKGQD